MNKLDIKQSFVNDRYINLNMIEISSRPKGELKVYEQAQ
jgi:hypothetical protein